MTLYNFDLLLNQLLVQTFSSHCQCSIYSWNDGKERSNNDIKNNSDEWLKISSFILTYMSDTCIQHVVFHMHIFIILADQTTQSQSGRIIDPTGLVEHEGIFSPWSCRILFCSVWAVAAMFSRLSHLWANIIKNKSYLGSTAEMQSWNGLLGCR